MSTWVKMNAEPPRDDWYSIISKLGDKPAYNTYLYNDANKKNKLCVDFSLSSGQADLWNIGQTIDLPIGQWLHITTTFDGTEFRLYVNGVLDATEDKSGTIVDSTGVDVYLGGDGNDNLSGAMDESRITDTVLSADWVKLDYETQKVGQTVVDF